MALQKQHEHFLCSCICDFSFLHHHLISYIFSEWKCCFKSPSKANSWNCEQFEIPVEYFGCTKPCTIALLWRYNFGNFVPTQAVVLVNLHWRGRRHDNFFGLASSSTPPIFSSLHTSFSVPLHNQHWFHSKSFCYNFLNCFFTKHCTVRLLPTDHSMTFLPWRTLYKHTVRVYEYFVFNTIFHNTSHSTCICFKDNSKPNRQCYWD